MAILDNSIERRENYEKEVLNNNTYCMYAVFSLR